MNKPPDPPPAPSLRLSVCHLQKLYSAALDASGFQSTRIVALLASHPFADFRGDLNRDLLLYLLWPLGRPTLLGSMNPWQCKNELSELLPSCSVHSSSQLFCCSQTVVEVLELSSFNSVCCKDLSLVLLPDLVPVSGPISTTIAADLGIQSIGCLHHKDGIISPNFPGQSLHPSVFGIQISPIFLSLLCALVFLQLLRLSLLGIGWIFSLFWLFLWKNSFYHCMRCSHCSYPSPSWLLSQLLTVVLILLSDISFDMFKDICGIWLVWALSVVATNVKPLILNDWGIRLCCCIGLDGYDQFLNSCSPEPIFYTRCVIITSLFLLGGLKDDRSCGFSGFCWVLVIDSYGNGCGPAGLNVIMNMIAQVLLPTFTVIGSFSTGHFFLGYAFWWLFNLDFVEHSVVMASVWAQLERYCWLTYNLSHRLHNWLWIIFPILDLRIGYKWTKLSEFLFRFYLWPYAIYSDVYFVEANSRQVPGWCGRIQVALVQGKHSDPITPRCGYCGLKGSMMLFVHSEISQIVLLLPLWYFNPEFLLFISVISWTFYPSPSESSFIDFTEYVNGDGRTAYNWSVRHWLFPFAISGHVSVCVWTFWKSDIGSGIFLSCVTFESSVLHPMYRGHISVTTDCWHFIINYSNPLFQFYGITVSYCLATQFFWFMLGWFSTVWSLCWAVFCSVWPSIMRMGLCFSMSMPWIWLNVCYVYILAMWFRIWGELSYCSSGNKNGCVPGCVLHRSVAPCRGVQPWIRTPRCCLLWPNWSMMGSAVSETFFFDLQIFLPFLSLSSDEFGLFFTVFVISTRLFSQYWIGFFNLPPPSQSCLCYDLPRSTFIAPINDEDFVLHRYQLWVTLSYVKAELCWREEHSLQIVSGRRSIFQLAFVLMCNSPLFYWMEGLNILLCCKIFCLSGLMSLNWLLLCLASEDRRGCISFRNSKALFQTAFGLRLQLLWLSFICLVFSTELSPPKIFLR